MPFVISAAVALAITPAVSAVARRVRLVDRPGELKIHEASVPLSGGTVIVLALAVTALVAEISTPAAVAAAVIVALVGGLVDDAVSLSPLARIPFQLAAGLVLVSGGLSLEPLGELGPAALVLAAVALQNAVNMLDGQDGLVAGLAAVAAAGFAVVTGTPLAWGMAGACIGFLAWNRPPARAFLGDGGAYATAVLLAAFAADATADGWHGLLAAGAILGVPALELCTTVVRRIRSSSPAIRGDRQHVYDRLAERFGSRPASTVAMWAVGAACAGAGIAISGGAPAVSATLLVVLAAALLLLDRLAPPIPEGVR